MSLRQFFRLRLFHFCLPFPLMSEKPSPTILTHGIDHVGLTVADLQLSIAFFVGCLGWHLLGERPDYPAAFVGDGQTRVTLWQVSDKADFVGFDRHRNVGLHHLALRVLSLENLHELHQHIAAWPGIVVFWVSRNAVPNALRMPGALNSNSPAVSEMSGPTGNDKSRIAVAKSWSILVVRCGKNAVQQRSQIYLHEEDYALPIN